MNAKRLAMLDAMVRRLRRKAPGAGADAFPGSAAYWERRYARGGDSGAGSSGELARFKAEVLNAFVAGHGVRSVIELGCGDGNQLALAEYPEYLGFDASASAVQRCRERFAGDARKAFRPMGEYRGERAELALSLDVVFHLVEERVFEAYMATLFDAAERYVIVYSSNSDDNSGHDRPHIRHREFTRWVSRRRPRWLLAEHVPNRHPYRGDPGAGSFAAFFVYERA